MEKDSLKIGQWTVDSEEGGPARLGKRFACSICGTEGLVRKQSSVDSIIKCCGKPMYSLIPKPLPSAD